MPLWDFKSISDILGSIRQPIFPMKKYFILPLLLINASLGGAPVSSITWQSAQAITGDSDVKTNGSLLYAYNVGATGVSGTTVNSVAFLAYAFPANYNTNTVTVGSVAMTEIQQGYSLVSSNSLGGSSAPFTSLSSGYQTLLGSGGSSSQPASISVVFNGLTSGQQYLVQWWTNNSANGTIDSYLGLNNTTATSNLNAVTLDANTTNVVGGLGQYVTGTFTATGTSQSMSLAATGTDAPLISAFQVRAVPEPSAALLGGLGLLALLRRRRN